MQTASKYLRDFEAGAGGHWEDVAVTGLFGSSEAKTKNNHQGGGKKSDSVCGMTVQGIK